LALFLNVNFKFFYRLSFLIYIPLAIFIVSKTRSQQGFLVFAAGSSVVIYLWLIKHPKFKKFNFLYVSVWISGVSITLLDILQKSPWTPILYKESVTYRGDFWRAGWNMTIDNPVFGVGPGNYRDNFRLYRDSVSANRTEISSQVDSAHNILLDISSSGGFLLLVFYIGILILTIVSAIKVIRNSESFDSGFVGIFGAWIAYTAQSLISVNQIGIAIWGWILSGLIIGYTKRGSSINYFTRSRSGNFKIFAVSLGLILGILLSLPFMVSDARFRSTILSGDVNRIMSVVQRWPHNSDQMSFVITLFRDGGFPDQSLFVARKAVQVFPNDFNLWHQLYMSQNATKEEKDSALTQMKILDPLNPILD
jgi:hypothetical protein